MRRSGFFSQFILLAAIPATLHGQQRKLRIAGEDGQPVLYAWVQVEGSQGQISDEKGEVSLGAGKRQTLVVHVRRVGYQPWFGKLELPDTAVTLTVTLPRLSQALGAVQITGTARVLSAPLQGFYDRWMMRQKGLLSATFIGPEEMEQRHPAFISDMLWGINGVQMIQGKKPGVVIAYGYSRQCVMTILVDGHRQCPPSGCHVNGGGNVPEIMGGGNNGIDNVNVNNVVEANDVAAIEVYTRGGNMPTSLQASDQGCGVINFITGSRQP
jgi:hypothetical protein